MAGTGTYSAYKSQPTSIPTYDDDGAFKRMAESAHLEKLDRRREQQRLALAGEEAVELAIEAGNIDVSALDGDLQEMLAKRLNAYQEEMVNAQDAIKQDPSFKNRMTLLDVKNKFTNNINSIKGIGNVIKEVSDPTKYDNRLALEGLNGMNKFVLNIGELTKKYDPINGTIDGKSIEAVLREYFDPSKLIAPVDIAATVNKYADNVFEGIKPNTTVDINGNIITSTERLEYDPVKARSLFLDVFDGTHEHTKKTLEVIEDYNRGGESAKALEKYVTHNPDGSIDFTIEDFYELTRDTELERRAMANVKETGYIDRSANTAAPKKTQAQIKGEEDDDRLFERITDFVAGTSDDVSQLKITIDGKSRQVKGGKMTIDPVSGEEVFKVDYVVLDSSGEQTIKSEYLDANNAAQLLGTAIKPSFDYNGMLQERQAVDPNIQKPANKLTTEEKSAEIDKRVAESSQRLLDKISAGGNDEDGVVDDVKEWVNKEGGINQSFMDFVNKKFKVSGGGFFGAGINAVNFGGSEYMDYNINSASDREILTKDLVSMNVYAKQLQAKGVSPDDVYAKLDEFAKKKVRNERLELNKDLQNKVVYTQQDTDKVMTFLKDLYPTATTENLELVITQAQAQGQSVDEFIAYTKNSLKK